MDWQRFPGLDQAPADFLQQLQQQAQRHRFSAGEWLVQEGTACGALALMLSGRVRVFKMAESGRAITLYRIGPGESCVLNTACVLGGGRFPAWAQVEEGGEALLVPAPLARQWLDEQPAWREYVLHLYSQRLMDVVLLVEEVAFRKMDQRLASLLLEKARGEQVAATHQALADELGTAREVVSRLMHNFTEQGWLHTRRGVITLTDIPALHRYAESGRL